MRDAEKHPWILGGLRITRAAIERVHEEARGAYGRDEESCGVLVGPATDPALCDEVVPFQNRAAKLHALDPVTYPRTARTYFDLDPLKFQRAVDAGERDGRPVKVLYHSHLDVGAYFSETDAAAATMGGAEPTHDVAYLVTSVIDGKVERHELFVWDPEARAFAKAAIEVLAG
jgi:proteasome lid subunit RPN8/RPN11